LVTEHVANAINWGLGSEMTPKTEKVKTQ